MDDLFRQEVLDNKNHRLDGVVSLVQPPIFKSLALLIIIVISISLFFLSEGSYTRKERVNGILQPNTGLLKLGAPQTGIVTELLVFEGQRVKKGQPVLRIKSEKHGLEGFELNQSLINQYQFQINSLNQQISKQKTQNRIQINELKYNYSNLIQRLAQLDIQKNIFQRRIKIKKDLVDQVSSLANTGYVTGFELMKQKDALLVLKQQSSSMKSEELLLNNQIDQVKSQLIQMPIEQSKIVIQYETQMEEVKLQLSKIKQQRIGELRSPMNGIVTGILTKTGKTVIIDQNLMSVIPEGSVLQGVIYVPTSAFGFIGKGQKIRIRYHAFPYEKFGIYDGQILEVSENVILPSETDTPGIISQPSYRVVVKLVSDKINAYGREFPLRAGMMLDADIIMEERSLLRWLFDPIFSVKGRL